MRKQDHLVRLIHSLTPSEKKYFRQFMAAHGDSKEYIKLFEVLQKSTAYDADAVSSELKKSKKNLADDKDYLQEILLRSLQNFHAQSMYRTRVFNGLTEADILIGKGLHEFALARLRKLKKGMLPGEENLLSFQVLAQEIMLVRLAMPGGLKADEWVKTHTAEIASRMDAMMLHNKLVNIDIKVQALSADLRYTESREVQDKARALVNQAKELARGKNLSSFTFITYHHMLAQYYFFLGIDTQQSILHAKQVLRRYESETESFKDFHKRTNYLINNCLLQAYFEMRDYRNAALYLGKLREYIASHQLGEMHKKAEMRVITFSVLLYTSSEKHDQALSFIRDNMAKCIDLRVPAENISVIQLLKAVNLFHLQRSGEALTELMPLLSTDAPPQLPETRISARALNLMIQYEMGNISALPDYLRAAQRFFKKEELITEEVGLFMELMRHLVRSRAKTPVPAFQAKFEKVYSLHRFELIGYFVIWPWLKRLAQKKY